MTNTRFLIAAAMVLGLTGCGSMGENTSMYSVHQPVVQRANYAIDVNVDGSGVSHSEQIRMAQWFDALELRYGDRVSVDYGDGYANPSVQQSIARLAADRGVLVAEAAPVTAHDVVPGTVRVLVSRSTASVPTCPNWKTESEANYNSGNHSNYGCATNSNLAAMVADPEDLVRGRKKTALDEASGTKAIEAYRAKTKGGN